MGLIGRVIGGAQAVEALGTATKGVAEVFTPSATRRMELSAEAQRAALDQLGDEFRVIGGGWFDACVNGLNRLPRPLLAFGTLGMFAYAMVDPISFAQRMVGLAYVPEPLWWLLGAIVSFYFGAREAYYFRNRRTAPPPPADGPASPDANPALDDWRAADGS